MSRRKARSSDGGGSTTPGSNITATLPTPKIFAKSTSQGKDIGGGAATDNYWSYANASNFNGKNWETPVIKAQFFSDIDPAFLQANNAVYEISIRKKVSRKKMGPPTYPPYPNPRNYWKFVSPVGISPALGKKYGEGSRTNTGFGPIIVNGQWTPLAGGAKSSYITDLGFNIYEHIFQNTAGVVDQVSNTTGVLTGPYSTFTKDWWFPMSRGRRYNNISHARNNSGKVIGSNGVTQRKNQTMIIAVRIRIDNPNWVQGANTGPESEPYLYSDYSNMLQIIPRTYFVDNDNDGSGMDEILFNWKIRQI